MVPKISLLKVFFVLPKLRIRANLLAQREHESRIKL